MTEEEANLIKTFLQCAEACADAAINYDAAIKACANDPARMTSYQTGQGEDLDTLYARWIFQAQGLQALTVVLRLLPEFAEIAS